MHSAAKWLVATNERIPNSFDSDSSLFPIAGDLSSKHSFHVISTKSRHFVDIFPWSATVFSLIVLIFPNRLWWNRCDYATKLPLNWGTKFRNEKKNGFQRIELRRQSFTTHRLWLEMLRHNRTFFKRNFFSTFDLIVISSSSPCSTPPNSTEPISSCQNRDFIHWYQY